MKKSKYKSIPISAAREIAKKYDKQQVIIVAWDSVHGKEHVTTYGTTVEACKQAAQGGNKVKKALNWPEELCNALPKTTKAIKDAEHVGYSHRFNDLCSLCLDCGIHPVSAPFHSCIRSK